MPLPCPPERPSEAKVSAIRVTSARHSPAGRQLTAAPRQLLGDGAGLAPDHADPAGWLRVLEAGDCDIRRAGLDRHGNLRDQRDTDAGTDHLHERRERAAVEDLAGADRAHVAEGECLFAKTMALLQEQQTHLAQHVAARHGLVGILLGTDEHEAFLEQGHFGQRRLGHRQGDDRGVQAPFRQFLQKLRRYGFANMDVEIGIFPGECRNHSRKKIRRHRRNDPDAQAPDQVLAMGPRKVAQFVHRAQDLAHPKEKFLAEGRQAQLSRSPFEELRTERFLQFLDLHRQSRLGNRTGFRGPSEMAMSGERLEITQLSQGEVYHNPILWNRS